MTEYPCQVCEAGAGPVRCSRCGDARCEEHLLLEVAAGEVGHTYVETQMRPGPVVHITPQGQPIHSPPWIPVQIPVSVQVPVLQATTHRGTVTNYAWPSAVDGVALSVGATRAAVQEWTASKRVCVWCREQAATGAARAALAAEARRARAEARERLRRDAEERERQKAREQERRARHAERITQRRREFGPEDRIKARIAGLRAIEARRPPGFRRGRLERFFDALPLWLALAALVGPFAAGWYWGASMVDHPGEGGVPFLTPLPIALGIGATLLCYGPSIAAMAWQGFNDPRRTRKADDARAQRRRLEGQLGCGISDCDLCAAT